MTLNLILSIILLSIGQATSYSTTGNISKYEEPLKMGVIGLVHTHVHWILGREEEGDIEIVAIVEPNMELARRYADQHGYSMDIVYPTMEEMVENVNVEVVTAFNTIYGHLEVVEFCAPRGIHVMVEKPLAVNLEHALIMEELARENNIHLLTNYETSWYPSTHLTYEKTAGESEIGEISKLKFYTGHPGPLEIGCNEEFLEWLTDPELNGGGALTDFGCYGANISTWLMRGENPLSVTAITNQIKPNIYPNVEDDATIIIDYQDAQCIIEASWNWSHNRKDMEVYGTTGYIQSTGGTKVKLMLNEEEGSFVTLPEPLEDGFQDPFALFHNIVKKEYKLDSFDLSGLENNMMVIKILELARISAEEGCTLLWSDYYE